jgi:hypothetical protein
MREEIVRTSRAFARFACFMFWYCHVDNFKRL